QDSGLSGTGTVTISDESAPTRAAKRGGRFGGDRRPAAVAQASALGVCPALVPFGASATPPAGQLPTSRGPAAGLAAGAVLEAWFAAGEGRGEARGRAAGTRALAARVRGLPVHARGATLVALHLVADALDAWADRVGPPDEGPTAEA